MFYYNNQIQFLQWNKTHSKIINLNVTITHVYKFWNFYVTKMVDAPTKKCIEFDFFVVKKSFVDEPPLHQNSCK